MSEQAEPGERRQPVCGTRSVDIAVYLMLLGPGAAARLRQLADRHGVEADGPQAGYFPFYLSVLLGAGEPLRSRRQAVHVGRAGRHLRHP